MYVSIISRYTAYFFYNKRVILLLSCVLLHTFITGYRSRATKRNVDLSKNRIVSIMKVTGQTRTPLAIGLILGTKSELGLRMIQKWSKSEFREI